MIDTTRSTRAVPDALNSKPSDWTKKRPKEQLKMGTHLTRLMLGEFRSLVCDRLDVPSGPFFDSARSEPR